KAVGDLADVATADLRAAQELGYNPKEYSWIKERVLEAQMLRTNQSLNRQISDLEKGSSQGADGSPAKEYNAGLIARYKAGFDEVAAEEQRISKELGNSSRG